MQFIGTEMFQYKIQELIPECDRNFWIKSFVNTVNKNRNIVISDMRFLHEYNYLKKHLLTHELIVIRIENLTKTIYDAKDTHVSEIEYTKIPIDFNVTNNMTTDIKSSLDTIMNAL